MFLKYWEKLLVVTCHYCISLFVPGSGNLREHNLEEFMGIFGNGLGYRKLHEKQWLFIDRKVSYGRFQFIKYQRTFFDGIQYIVE